MVFCYYRYSFPKKFIPENKIGILGYVYKICNIVIRSNGIFTVFKNPEKCAFFLVKLKLKLIIRLNKIETSNFVKFSIKVGKFL